MGYRNRYYYYSYPEFLPHNSKHRKDHLDPLFHSFSLLVGHPCLHNNLDVALGLGTCKNENNQHFSRKINLTF